MLYKIISTVNARIDASNNIVSSTQSFLQNNILQESPMIPDTVRKKILDANVVVEKGSVRHNAVCKGDIYLNTSTDLSLLEQRQLVNGMTNISLASDNIMMSPIIIRNSPDKMPEPALEDNDFIYHNGSAFIGSFVRASFNNMPVKMTYKNANLVARSLNDKLNKMGLKTIFADMSVLENREPIIRDCCILFQKTSMFNENTFSDECLKDAIKDGFSSKKINAAQIKSIDILSTENKMAIIGTIPFEYCQFAGAYVSEQFMRAKSSFDKALIKDNANNNPLFVNGVSSFKLNKETPMFLEQIPKHDGLLFQSSTEQALSKKWQKANAFSIRIFGNIGQFNVLCESINDIKLRINELNGSDEQKPIVTNILFGNNVSNSKNFMQSAIIEYNKDTCQYINAKDIINDLSKAMSEYSVLSGMKLYDAEIRPLIAEVELARPIVRKEIEIEKQNSNEVLKDTIIKKPEYQNTLTY